MNWVEAIRRIPRSIDFAGKYRDMLDSETFCSVEARLATFIDRLRTQVHAARAAGLDTTALVRHYDAAELSGDVEHAWLSAYFAGAERGARIGADAAQRAMHNSLEFAQNFTDSHAPWLSEEKDDND